MADEPDRNGSDEADEQPSASTEETPTGDGDDAAHSSDDAGRSADDDAGDSETDDGADEGTDDDRVNDDENDETANDETGDEGEGGDDGETADDDTGDEGESGETADDDGDDSQDHGGISADDGVSADGEASEPEGDDGTLQREPDGQRDDDSGGRTDDADGSATDDEADQGDSDSPGNADREDGEPVDRETDAGDETGDEDESVAEDDDAFPVSGMTAEEAAYDPAEPGDPEDLAVDVDEVESENAVGEPADEQPVGVQPEKQEITDDFWGDGPESDQEMPLADHIEEMMRRLGVVFLVGGVVTLLVLGAAQAIEGLPTAVDIIDALWNHNIPGAPEQADRRPRVYGPLELILTKLKVAGLAGLLVGLPVFVYETYLFMRPGLYPRERRYYLAAVPTSLVLGIIGMTFAHFVVLPTIFSYFTTYTVESATVAFGLAETFNLILLLMGYMAIVFQIPLFIMLAIMMNLVTRVWLEDKRLLFWGGFAGLAFLASPDPTGMAPIIIAATMIVLYEGTLALLRWTGN